MKNNRSGIFRRISVFVFLIITVLCSVFIIITCFALTYFYRAGTQLLDKDIATHIAEFTSPYEKNTINKQKADSVFYNAMVLNPSIEVYFLDTAGNVMYYQSADTLPIQLHKIPLADVRQFIYSAGDEYVSGYDPKHPDVKKIFSAAPVYKNHELLGYIYVILDSNDYGNAGKLLFKSHAVQFVITAFIIVVLISLFISIYYIKRLQGNYKKVLAVLEEYQKGNYYTRFETEHSNEFTPVTETFNAITGLLTTNMEKLQKSETDRKDFVAAISHDLQSPLSVAKGYTETMLIKSDLLSTPERDAYLKLVQVKITQVEKMVRQLTELSKIEEADFKPKKEPFILSEIVQETVHTYQLAASEKKVTLLCTQCQDHVWVNADISMMERVVQNLIDNAVKNTFAGGLIDVCISIETQIITVEITNTGKPVNEALLTWINSAQQELGDRPTNTGLGILIVKKILRLHNISLHAFTKKDTNTFLFKVPVIQQPLTV